MSQVRMKMLLQSYLNLVKQINYIIETIISDDTGPIKAAVHAVFPEAAHKLCAWHLVKSISDPKIRKLFWDLIHSDHPLIFQAKLVELISICNGCLPDALKNAKI